MRPCAQNYSEEKRLRFFLETKMAQAVEIFVEGNNAFLAHYTVAVDDLVTQLARASWHMVCSYCLFSNEITDPFANLNRCTVDTWEVDK